MPTLDTIRHAIPESLRERLYTYVAAGILLLSGLGLVTDSVASLWSAVGIACVTLLFALLHSTSPWRSALYGLLVAVSPLALWYSIGTATGWAAVIAFSGTIFGINKAAINTLTRDAGASMKPMLEYGNDDGTVTIIERPDGKPGRTPVPVEESVGRHRAPENEER